MSVTFCQYCLSVSINFDDDGFAFFDIPENVYVSEVELMVVVLIHFIIWFIFTGCCCALMYYLDIPKNKNDINDKNYNLLFAYELNFKYKNIYECNICYEPFNKSKQKEIILQCGHRFHKSCCKNWEEQQIKQYYMPRRIYKCAICRTEYHTIFDKWDYVYHIK